MKTAMQELIEHIQVNGTKFSLMNTYNILKEIEPYLEIEKKQHETTFHRGINIGALNPELDIEGRKKSARHYYETTFDKVDNQKELIVVDNEELTPKCYVVVSCSMNEGYYFDNSYVFKNRMNAEKYIEQLDSEDTFDMVELNLID